MPRHRFVFRGSSLTSAWRARVAAAHKRDGPAVSTATIIISSMAMQQPTLAERRAAAARAASKRSGTVFDLEDEDTGRKPAVVDLDD